MKSITAILSIVLLSFLQFACENDPEDIFEPIKLPVTLSQTMNVEVTSTDETTRTVLLDATTNDDIKDYLNGIQGYEITSLKFAIENYEADTEDEYYLTGELGFSRKSENAATISCAISDLPVTNWAGTGDFEIAGCVQKIEDISAILTSDNALKIYLNGSFSGQPFSFDLKTTVSVTVTANPLQ